MTSAWNPKPRPRAFSTRATVAAVLFLFLTPALLMVSSPALGEEAAVAYGEELTLTEATPLEQILADPEKFDGRKVRIEGTVKEVCAFKGCWMDLGAKTGPSETVLRVKVDDGVIVFPTDSVGSTAVAEGVVELIEMSREQYLRWRAHEAEEKGETFDPSTVGEGPFRRVQIRGAGARISEASDTETRSIL